MQDDSVLACRELNGLLRQDVQLLVRQNRPKIPLATRNLYLQARPVEVYPVVYSLLPGSASCPPQNLESHMCSYSDGYPLCSGWDGAGLSWQLWKTLGLRRPRVLSLSGCNGAAAINSVNGERRK